MAVDVIAPDARKKVDELFLYWLSEPSTQDILRRELARVCGLQQQKFDLLGPVTYAHHRSRPTSPIVRDVTPPPGPSTSPSRSPKPSTLLVNQTVDKAAVKKEIDGPDHIPVSSLVGAKTEAEVTTTASNKETLPAAVKPVCIPPFYFPKGQPKATKDSKALQKAERVLQRYANQEITKKDFHQVVKVRLHCMHSACSLLHDNM